MLVIVDMMYNIFTIVGRVFSFFLHINPAIQLVLLTLLSMSFVSCTIFFGKLIFLKKLKKGMKQFDDKFWSGLPLEDIYNQSNGDDTEKLPYNTQMFVLTMDEWLLSDIANNQSSVELTKIGTRERFTRVVDNVCMKFDKFISTPVSILQTIASCSPFIGLFGTVVGVMNSFSAIAKSGNAGINIVAPGIAEALFTTAFGIFVAIVSTIFCQYLSSKQDVILLELESFENDLLNILSRELDKISINNYNAYNLRSSASSPSTIKKKDMTLNDSSKNSAVSEDEDGEFDIDDL